MNYVRAILIIINQSICYIIMRSFHLWSYPLSLSFAAKRLNMISFRYFVLFFVCVLAVAPMTFRLIGTVLI